MKKAEYDLLVMERERLKKLLGSRSKGNLGYIEQRLNIVRETLSNAHREKYKNETKH